MMLHCTHYEYAPTQYILQIETSQADPDITMRSVIHSLLSTEGSLTSQRVYMYYNAILSNL